MIDTIIEPRFSETDALGHIGNTVMPVWFEHARSIIFKKLHPSLDIEGWPLIIAHIDVDFIRQAYIGSDVTVKIGISKLGDKSFTVYHEAWQREQKIATGNAVHVFFDFATNSTVAMPEDAREKLKPLLIDDVNQDKN